MAISDARKRANAKYENKAYDKILLRVEAGKKAEIKAHAEQYQPETGEIGKPGYTPKGSVNGFISRAIDETMKWDRTKAKKLTGNFKLCVEEANEFLRAAQWYAFEKRGEIEGEPDWTIMDEYPQRMYPFTVNVALSCELYIKAIRICRSPKDEFAGGHDLKELFSGLSLSDQAAVRGVYARECTMPLNKLLDESPRPFPEWRYAFQKKEVSICMDGIFAFAQSLKEYVVKCIDEDKPDAKEGTKG